MSFVNSISYWDRPQGTGGNDTIVYNYTTYVNTTNNISSVNNVTINSSVQCAAGSSSYLYNVTLTNNVLSGLCDPDAGGAASVHLDEILNPAGNTNFNMGAWGLNFTFSGAIAKGIEIEGVDGFTDDLLHIHQHTGNVAAGTDLLHVETSDVDAIGINITTTGSTALITNANITAFQFFGLLNASNVRNFFWLNLTDQRYNESKQISDLNITKLDASHYYDFYNISNPKNYINSSQDQNNYTVTLTFENTCDATGGPVSIETDPIYLADKPYICNSTNGLCSGSSYNDSWINDTFYSKAQIQAGINPASNNTGSIGTTLLKWANIFAVNVSVGDILFANGARLYEVGTGLIIKDRTGSIILNTSMLTNNATGISVQTASIQHNLTLGGYLAINTDNITARFNVVGGNSTLGSPSQLSMSSTIDGSYTADSLHNAKVYSFVREGSQLILSENYTTLNANYTLVPSTSVANVTFTGYNQYTTGDPSLYFFDGEQFQARIWAFNAKNFYNLSEGVLFSDGYYQENHTELGSDYGFFTWGWDGVGDVTGYLVWKNDTTHGEVYVKLPSECRVLTDTPANPICDGVYYDWISDGSLSPTNILGVTMNWSSAENAEGYIIYKWDNVTNDFTEGIIVEGNNASTVDRTSNVQTLASGTISPTYQANAISITGGIIGDLDVNGKIFIKNDSTFRSDVYFDKLKGSNCPVRANASGSLYCGTEPVVTEKYNLNAYNTTSNTVWYRASELGSTLSGNSTYSIQCNLLTQALAATTGEQINITFSIPVKTFISTYQTFTSASAYSIFNGKSNVSNTYLDTGSAGANVLDVGRLQGYVQTGVSNTDVLLYLKSEVSSSPVVIERGSYCKYTKI